MAPYLTCWEQNQQNSTGFTDPLWNNNISEQCINFPHMCLKYQTQGPNPGRGDVCDHNIQNNLPNMCYFNMIFLPKIDPEKSWTYKCWHDSLCPIKDAKGNGITGCLITSKRISCCCNEADFCNGQQLFTHYAVWGRPDHYPPNFTEISSYDKLYPLLQSVPPSTAIPTITTNTPSKNPTEFPTISPSNIPSILPTTNPISSPSINPTFIPSTNPTLSPTNVPTLLPSINPSFSPSEYPSELPTLIPSINPTIFPTKSPSDLPTMFPTKTPTNIPTNYPSLSPTLNPSYLPSLFPTFNPSISPSNNPTITPTLTPSQNPSMSPISNASMSPISNASMSPVSNPSMSPISNASMLPISNPSMSPISDASMSPISNPTQLPSIAPSNSPITNVVIAANTDGSNEYSLLHFDHSTSISIVYGLVGGGVIGLMLGILVFVVRKYWKKKQDIIESNEDPNKRKYDGLPHNDQMEEITDPLESEPGRSSIEFFDRQINNMSLPIINETEDRVDIAVDDDETDDDETIVN